MENRNVILAIGMTIPITTIFSNGYKLILEAKWQYVFLFPIPTKEPNRKFEYIPNFLFLFQQPNGSLKLEEDVTIHCFDESINFYITFLLGESDVRADRSTIRFSLR